MKKMVVLWLVSLVVAGIVASGMTALAQGRGTPFFVPLPEPIILSGADVGFRIEGKNGDGVPVGSVVVRVNGEWIATGMVPGNRRATQ
jgi:hypothetical protein